MSFWSDATPGTKGVVVVGPILILFAALYYFGVIGGGEEPQTERGLPPPSEAAP